MLGSEFIVRKFIMPNHPYENLKYELHNKRPAFAAFADSHGANALQSHTDMANFSFRGDNLQTIMKKIRLFTQHHKPEGIILQADPHQFAAYRIMADQTALQTDLSDRSTPALAFLRPVYRQYLIEYWKEFLKRIIWNRPSEDGQTSSEIRRLTELNVSEVRSDAERRVQLHSPLPEFWESQGANDYRNIVNEMTRDGIKVCMVTFPLSSVYREKMADISMFAKSTSFFRDLKNDNNVTYIDFSETVPDQYFSDPDHLNSEGAYLFTKTVLNSCFRTIP